MNLRAAILARIALGPADLVDLHGSVMHACGISPDNAGALWGMIRAEADALVGERLIRADPGGCWTILVGADRGDQPTPPRLVHSKPKPAVVAKPGTITVQQYRELMEKQRKKKRH